MMEQHHSIQQKGFSLLEGLIALALISTVTAMAVISFGTMNPNAKANAAMDELLYQLRSARERAISHRCLVQVQFVGNNQVTLSELWNVGVPPAPTTVTFEGGAQYVVFPSVPDVPAPYNYGNNSAIYIGGISGGPPVMEFTSSGAFVSGANAFLNGTVFLGIPGNSATARAITILGATGRVREYHWTGTAWSE
jgi:prepilin-type N-terminal cleavage/methylation domain-containing protein